MTTDPFIEAAHTEVKRMYRDGVNRAHNLAMMEARGGFIAGARWARARLTAQDARVEYRATRAEAQSAIRGRAVVMYRERAREAEARIKAVQDLIDQADTAGDWTVTCSRLQWAIDGTTPNPYRASEGK